MHPRRPAVSVDDLNIGKSVAVSTTMIAKLNFSETNLLCAGQVFESTKQHHFPIWQIIFPLKMCLRRSMTDNTNFTSKPPRSPEISITFLVSCVPNATIIRTACRTHLLIVIFFGLRIVCFSVTSTYPMPTR